MQVSPTNSSVLRFAAFEFDLRAGELRKRGIRIRLEGQPLAILTMLLERPGELVTREDLQGRLWPVDTFVDFEHSLNAAVKRLRAALSDSANAPRYIETLAGRGYRFMAPLDHVFPVFVPAAAAVSKPERVADSSAPPASHGHVVWLATAATLLVVALAAWGWLHSRRTVVGSRLNIRSLAVLPLENLSGDASQDYFADGMTDALITDLAQIADLRVISRTSVMRYKGTRNALPDIARELGVDGIVEGTVARSGNRVRITSQLIYGPSDQHLWARTYERDLGDVLKLQGEVAQAIAGEVRAAVTPEQRVRFSATATVNPKAYEAYLKGRYFWNKRTQEGLRTAMEYFQQAVDEDPAYAPAYAGLADTYFPLVNWGWISIEEAIPNAKAAALKAVELDERLAEAHVSLGMVRFEYDWDWPEAGKHFERALALNPASPAAHRWYANYLMILRRSDEALTEAKRGVDLDPVSPDVNHHVAWLLSVAGRYDEAIEWERRTLEMDPGFPPAYAVLESAYEGKGMHKEALAEAKRLAALSPDTTVALSSLASIHARSGERSQALRELAELGALSKHRYVPSIDFALVYLALGDKDQAFRWLEKACEERSSYLPWLPVHAKWAALRSDPRFSDVLRCVGLPE